MTYVFRSSTSPNAVRWHTQRYMFVYSGMIKNDTINDYLQRTYGISLHDALILLRNALLVMRRDNQFLEVSFNKLISVGNTTAETLADFLEYGNLEVHSPRLISKVLGNALHDTWNMINSR